MSRVKRHKLKRQTRENSKKNERISKQAILTIILGGLMVVSVFGIMLSGYNSGTESIPYNDHDFLRTQNGWRTEINDQEVYFTYHPSDIESLELSSSAKSRLKNLKVGYVTFDPNAQSVQEFELLRFELSKTLGELMSVYLIPSISAPSEAYNQPIVTCANATISMPVLNIIESNRTGVFLDGNCINLEIIKQDMYAAGAIRDRIIYTVTGIIE